MIKILNEMVRIGIGSFLRGSTTYKQEEPVASVRLSPFWIDIYPVTNRRFARFLEADGYRRREFWTELGWQFIGERNIERPLYWNDPHWNRPKQPVTGVSWWEAMAFARFENKTLPTEAQWEAAAGLGRDCYPWGNADPDVNYANFAPGCEPTELDRCSTEVDALPAGRSRSGCYDMAGNVGEWCLDNASDNYNWDSGRCDPLYLVREEAPHMVRGGSGLHDEDNLRCASRDYYPPQLRDNIVGIRCVMMDIEEKDYE